MNLKEALLRIKDLEYEIQSLHAEAEDADEKRKAQAKLDGLTITDALNRLATAEETLTILGKTVKLCRQRYKEAESKLEAIQKILGFDICHASIKPHPFVPA
jgi:hypothetical protein